MQPCDDQPPKREKCLPAMFVQHRARETACSWSCVGYVQLSLSTAQRCMVVHGSRKNKHSSAARRSSVRRRGDPETTCERGVDVRHRSMIERGTRPKNCRDAAPQLWGEPCGARRCLPDTVSSSPRSVWSVAVSRRCETRQSPSAVTPLL